MLASAAAMYISASARAVLDKSRAACRDHARATLFQIAEGEPSQKMAMLVCSSRPGRPGVSRPSPLTSLKSPGVPAAIERRRRIGPELRAAVEHPRCYRSHPGRTGDAGPTVTTRRAGRHRARCTGTEPRTRRRWRAVGGSRRCRFADADAGVQQRHSARGERIVPFHREERRLCHKEMGQRVVRGGDRSGFR